MKPIYIILGILSLGLAMSTSAQNITIQALPQTGSLQTGLQGQAVLVNAEAQPQEVFLQAQVRNGNSLTFSDQTAAITLNPGLNSLDLAGLSLLGPRHAGQVQDRPVGDFELCLEVHAAADGHLLAESCETITVHPMTPPYLVYPFDGEKIETPMPMLSWTPPAPIKPGTQLSYTIRLAEVPTGMSPEAALRQRQPLFLQENVMMASMAYPVFAPELAQGKQYVWQVEAFVEGQSIGRSEVWDFTLAKQTPKAATEIPTYFVELKRQPEASIYRANEQICFKFMARYAEDLPRFEIHNDDQKRIDVRSTQLTPLGSGLFILKLPPQGGLKAGSYYTLQVFDAKDRAYVLKFQYQHADNPVKP